MLPSKHGLNVKYLQDFNGLHTHFEQQAAEFEKMIRHLPCMVKLKEFQWNCYDPAARQLSVQLGLAETSYDGICENIERRYMAECGTLRYKTKNDDPMGLRPLDEIESKIAEAEEQYSNYLDA